MKGADQPKTQNTTFEINCSSLSELKKFAKKHHRKIQSFTSSESKQRYRYNYIEIEGPKGICKIEINHCQDLPLKG